MSNQHIGNIQPTLDLEEHAQISGTNGKKVFVIDDADNQVTDFGGNYKDTGLEIAKGNVAGHSLVHKFGNAPDFDSDDGEVTVWDAAEDDQVWELMNYVYSSSAAIDSISSTNAGDSQDIEIQGLDSSWALSTQTVTLNGTTRVALGTNLIRVFRAKNVGSSNLSGHVIIYENDTTADDPGVPDDSNLIRAVIDPVNNQTEMAIYTIPSGYTGYLRSFYAASAGARQTADYLIRIKARPDGEVFQLKHKFTTPDGDIPYQHVYTDPQKFEAKTDIEMTAQIITGAKTAANLVGGFDIVLVQD